MFDDMFNNIGEKIKKYVKCFACFGMVASIVIGIICCVTGAFLAGILVGVLGFIGSWVGAWMMYGYGEMVQRLINIDRKLSSTQDQTRKFDPNKFKPVEKVEKAEDKETLYKFAVEQIEKKQYAFARDSLKRIAGYKDSDEILAKIESM